MAEKTPARLWLTAEEIGWPGSFRSFRLTDLEHPEEYPLYVRADSHDKLVEALRDVVTFAHFYHGKMEDTIGDEALDALGDTARAALASLQTQEGE